jgi:hypothetical protein
MRAVRFLSRVNLTPGHTVATTTEARIAFAWVAHKGNYIIPRDVKKLVAEIPPPDMIPGDVAPLFTIHKSLRGPSWVTIPIMN